MWIGWKGWLFSWEFHGGDLRLFRILENLKHEVT